MITFEDILYYTNRFNEIQDSSDSRFLKNARLTGLMSSLEATYKIPVLSNDVFERKNPFVMMLYRTISEARFPLDEGCYTK